MALFLAGNGRQRSQFQHSQGHRSQDCQSQDHSQGHQKAEPTQDHDQPDHEQQTWKIGVKKKAKGIKTAKTRAIGTTKVKVTAKEASIKTIGASPTKSKANTEDKSGNP
jgi:hypothetical protein